MQIRGIVASMAARAAYLALRSWCPFASGRVEWALRFVWRWRANLSIARKFTHDQVLAVMKDFAHVAGIDHRGTQITDMMKWQLIQHRVDLKPKRRKVLDSILHNLGDTAGPPQVKVWIPGPEVRLGYAAGVAIRHILHSRRPWVSCGGSPAKSTPSQELSHFVGHILKGPGAAKCRGCRSRRTRA